MIYQANLDLEEAIMFGKNGHFLRIVLLLLLCGLLLAACGSTSVASKTASTSTSVTTHPFQVTSVSMAVSPASIGGMDCGTLLTVTYTATFHVLAGGPGGTVHFSYTMDSGRSSPPAVLAMPAGVTTKAYTFAWHGQLATDNVVPGLGGIVVHTPDPLTSTLVKPTGTCRPVTPTPMPVVFVLTSITLTTSVNPTGPITCGTELARETYVATFHILPGGPGGTLFFSFTPDQSETTPGVTAQYSLPVDAGQTSVNYEYFWEDPISEGIALPGIASVHVSAPNDITSNTVAPLVTVCH